MRSNLSKMEREHALIVSLGGEPIDDLSGDMFEKDALGKMMIKTCALVAIGFFVLVAFEMKAAFKTVKSLKKWDEVKGEATQGGWSEEVLMEKFGEDLSVVDRQSILAKYRNRLESRASEGGNGNGNDDEEKEEGGIEMLEILIGNMVARGGEFERPFGGFGKHESVRHVSGADPVDLEGEGKEKEKEKDKRRGRCCRRILRGRRDSTAWQGRRRGRRKLKRRRRRWRWRWSGMRCLRKRRGSIIM